MFYINLENVIDLLKKAYGSAKEAERLAQKALDAAETAETELSEAYGELLRLYDQERNNIV